MSFFKINGNSFPTPQRGLIVQRQQLVNSGRNGLGEVVAQKINRRQIKFDSLVWAWLPADQWSDILQEIEKFEGVLTYWDALKKQIINRKVYWGDVSEEPFKINESTGEVLEYINCKCNLVDMGYEDV